MNRSHNPPCFFARHGSWSAFAYAGLLGISVLISFVSFKNIQQHYREYQATAEILSRLQSRAASLQREPHLDANPPPGGPAYLEGPSRTVAGAALMQRITDVITRGGGTITSSEIDPQAQSNENNHVRVVTTCELDQGALQQVLYEIEAGKPFLFVDQLVAQTLSLNDGLRIRLSLGVVGQWQAEK